MKLSRTLLDVLEITAWGERNFGSIITNRVLRRRDMMKAVSLGLTKSVGMGCVCDGDGFSLQPERYREGFKLTAKGKRAIAAHYRAASPATPSERRQA